MSDDKKEYGPLSIISQNELSRILGLSVSTIQKMRKAPNFPKRRAIPGGPKGWVYQEIETYILSSPIDEDDVEVQDNPELVQAVLKRVEEQSSKKDKKTA